MRLLVTLAVVAVAGLATALPPPRRPGANLRAGAGDWPPSECDLCKEGIAVLDELLDSELVKGNLEGLINQECQLLPSPYNTDCAASIDEIVDSVEKFIEDMLAEICPACCGCDSVQQGGTAANQFVRRVTKPQAGSNVICDVLQQLYNDVPNLLPELEQICDDFPDATMQANCHYLFQNDSSIIIEMVRDLIVWIANLVPFADCQIGKQ